MGRALHQTTQQEEGACLRKQASQTPREFIRGDDDDKDEDDRDEDEDDGDEADNDKDEDEDDFEFQLLRDIGAVEWMPFLKESYGEDKT